MLMSYNSEPSDNIYHTDYRADVHVHSRKGKIKNKYNSAKTNRKIIQHKKSNNISWDQWISSYDVHKFKSDKKRARIAIETIRTKGLDYKIFVADNEIPKDQNDSLNGNFVDFNDVFNDSYWDKYSTYSFDDYRDDWDDDNSYFGF